MKTILKYTLLFTYLVIVLTACESKSEAAQRINEQKHEGEVIVTVSRLRMTSISLIEVQGHLYLRETGAQPLHIVSCPCYVSN